ncbi:M1 family metallopeptidase [Janthinobacterium lividum]|uniref:M1 family metallopeptidase n=1 Tax=Janthinobacterium lividum TaxID=29581 RepID=UPI00044622E3|nr:M1 family metallopeptidase [Janthinobacterium lividum]EZP37623.1 Peptidase M1 alanine aminopeptidase [Janthinobacterium lividum]
MKHIPLLLSCLLLSACATRAPTAYTLNSGAERTPEQLAVVFEHADLTLRIDPASRSIAGDARLTFLATQPISRFALDLDRNLPVDTIEIDGKALRPQDYANPDGRLSMTLPATLAAGARTTIRVVYHGVPHVAVKAPWDGGMVWSSTADGAPWIASAVQGEGCDLFWPCIDHPMGKARLIDQHIIVPAPLVAAGNGIALGMDEADGWRTWHWRAKHPSTYGIALNVAPYRSMQSEYVSRYGNRIPLQFWYLPESEAKADALFAELPPMLNFFESVIGPYPFADEKVGIAETPHKGMEHQTINAYGNKFAKTSYGYDELLQHEFAHEWFGNQLTNSNWDDMWLHEGFGTYMQPLYMQYLRGEQEYFASLQQMRAGIVNKAPMVSGKPKSEEEVYDLKKGGPGGDLYVKGALVLHTLRGLIGDDAFFRAVRLLVYGTEQPQPGQFQPRYGSTKEFMDIVNKVTGSNYDWFFQAYLYQAALPELSAVRDGDTLRLEWKTPADIAFPMPVEVRIGKEIHTVPMSLGFGELPLPAGATYTLDPHSRVLRRAEHIETFQKFREEQAKGKKG